MYDSYELAKEQLMKTILILFLSLFLTTSFAKGKKQQLSAEVKSKIAYEMKEFQKGNQVKRKELLDKIYQIRLEALKHQHSKQLYTLEKVSHLLDKIEFGNKEDNREIRQQIKELRASLKKEQKEARQHVKMEIKKLRQAFKQEQQRRRKEFKAKMKSLRGK